MNEIKCFYEHNGADTLLWATEYPGAYTRGGSLEIAKAKMERELEQYAKWSGDKPLADVVAVVTEEKESELDICDADSDAIFDNEKLPMSRAEYDKLKSLALKSASDFLTMYVSIPDKDKGCKPARKTFYGMTPSAATEMYEHTKNVNSYYFGEIGVDVDNGGDISTCRKRGFELLEKSEFLNNKVYDGSYGEQWSIKKVLRRFIWHDRIHARAMFRLARKLFGLGAFVDAFGFGRE